MNIYQARREKLTQDFENGDMVIVFASRQPAGISRFIQDNNFLYLTGLETPLAKLVLYKTNDKLEEVVFIEENIPERIVWDGEKLKPEAATEISGIEKIRFITSFDGFLNSILPQIELCFVNYGSTAIGKEAGMAHNFVLKLRDAFPHLMFEEFTKLIKPLRAIKDEKEIKNLQTAIDITGEGIMNILEQARAGMMEYQLESVLQHTMLLKGVRNFGFTPIVAGGKNAATLHYIDNNCEINEGDLVLLDVGASYNNYSADISRTFPISGKFNNRQKAVYQAVLDVQKETITMIKPGAKLKEINENSKKLIAKKCIELNLIEKEEDVTKYYMHGIGHHLGMDTHDLAERDSVLEEGNIITIEPGIYIPEENIGVRIEDDVLVTEDGFKILSAGIPKEIEELEEIRSEVLK